VDYGFAAHGVLALGSLEEVAVEMFMPFVKSSSRQRISQDLAGAVGSGEETTGCFTGRTP
jgi:hypothetical protein